MPWITIITVVRNESKTLRHTIENVLSLPYENLNYLIIDGGSTDGTVDIIRDYAGRMTWWESAPDNGIYDAMNKGWSRARDDSFIMFLGAGDRIVSLPQHMGRYDPDDVIYGKVTIGTDVVFSPRSDYHLKFYNSLHHQALLINKNINPDPPFDVAFKHYADFDFNQRLFKAGAKFVFDETFRAFALPDGITAKLDLKESLAVIFKNFGAVHAGVALTAFAMLRCFPYLRKFRPYREQSNLD